MHFVYLLARTYPLWAIPVILMLVQMVIFYRRRKHVMQGPTIALGVFLGIGILLWLFYRGDLHSDQWVRNLFGD